VAAVAVAVERRAAGSGGVGGPTRRLGRSIPRTHRRSGSMRFPCQPGCQIWPGSDGTVTEARTAARTERDGEPRLAETLAELRPEVIVVALKGIATTVARAATLAGCAEVERYTLTFPSRCITIGLRTAAN